MRLLSLGILVLAAAYGQQMSDPPLKNWPAPPQAVLQSPAKADSERAAVAALPSSLVAMEPCRVLDTRPSAPAVQRLISGPIVANTAVEVPMRTSGCSVPAGALGYSLNITVDTGATGLGFLSVWPTGSRPASLVSVLNATNGGAVANAAIVAAGTNGSIDLFASNPTHVIIDINGYFTASTQGPIAVYKTVRGPDTSPVCAAVLSTTGQDYSIREIDTDNAVTTGSLWRFTAPIAGYYSVHATLDQPYNAYEFVLERVSPLAIVLPEVRKVGVNSKTTTISTVVNLLAGDSIRTYTHNTSSCGGRGWISIHYVRP